MAIDPASLIQATLAPVFLISGTAVFLNFSQARLFRVTDRLRQLRVEASVPGADPGWHRAQVALYIRRGRIMRNAIVFGVLAVAFTVVTALLLLGSSLVSAPVDVYAPYAFALALLSFAAALVFVVDDTILSVRNVEREADAD
ncbi:MAG TPA: DUF2721 domain-containing protein [Candidatus Thermoplasmatota archaeon]|nr:DUF2721 domain-containing protein [Candidatus Thermoplasmatota archaeon]